ncbi:MAG: insulinase family protein [gamma proteobacterium symbiont of Bathyaustriella thionipta]|nr:insulinase family protein [gamma proteobacterium symbiont of Bathyaustriella thionipta]
MKLQSVKNTGLLMAVLLMLVSTPLLANPDILTWHTSNGAKVMFVPAPELPMLDVRITFDAGSARDGEQPGKMALLNNLLSEGAGDWTADQIAERMESVGAELSTSALRDMAIVSIRSLTGKKALHTALQTLAVVAVQPTLNKKDVERQREAMLIALRLSEQSPGSIASKRFYHAVFGQHPYASDPDGTEASLRAIRIADLRAAHARYYVAANATVAIVGDLDKAQAAAIAEQVTANLSSGKAAPPLPAVKPLQQAQTEQISFPSSQTHIYMGQPGMSRGDPDYFPLYVGNHILGGSGLVSRLSEEVREQRGLSYSVYSYFLPMRKAGVFMVGLQTKNSKASEALKVALDTVEKFIAQGPSEEELLKAKRNITGGFALRVDSNSKIMSYISMIGFYDLPLDYLDSFTDKVNAVSMEQIRDAFKRRLQPDKFATIVVGGAEASAAKP